MGVKKYNWLKKFIQVEIDIKCMQTNFGGVKTLPSKMQVQIRSFTEYDIIAIRT